MRASDESWDFSAISRRAFVRGAAGAGLGAVGLTGALAGCSTASGPEQPKGIGDVPQVQLGPETPGVKYPEGYVGPRATVTEPFGDGSTSSGWSYPRTRRWSATGTRTP